MKMLFTEVMGGQRKIEAAFREDELQLLDGILKKEDLIDLAADAALISVFIRTNIDKEVIDALPRLRMINTRSVGFDHIDSRYAAEKGITVTNVPDYGPHVVAEHNVLSSPGMRP